MRKLALTLAALIIAVPAYAAEIPIAVQVQVQSAMQQYIDQISVGGAYSFIDQKSSDLKTVYPANVHPMVLSFGDDFFVCSEVIDGGGKNLTADFLVRKFGDEYRVVQMFLDNRSLVEAAMAKLEK